MRLRSEEFRSEDCELKADDEVTKKKKKQVKSLRKGKTTLKERGVRKEASTHLSKEMYAIQKDIRENGKKKRGLVPVNDVWDLHELLMRRINGVTYHHQSFLSTWVSIIDIKADFGG